MENTDGRLNLGTYTTGWDTITTAVRPVVDVETIVGNA